MARRAWWGPHPDNPEHGHPIARNFSAEREDDEFGYDEPLAEEDVEAMWVEEKRRRDAIERELAAATRLHQHACGDDCTSGGCWIFGLMQSFLCPACEIRLHLI